jgi:hypothetical protein
MKRLILSARTQQSWLIYAEPAGRSFAQHPGVSRAGREAGREAGGAAMSDRWMFGMLFVAMLMIVFREYI